METFIFKIVRRFDFVNTANCAVGLTGEDSISAANCAVRLTGGRQH